MHAPETPAARHQRLKALFAEALDQPADARTVFLAKVELDDAAIAADVRALLAARLAEPDYLERDPHSYAGMTPATALPEDIEIPAGHRLGPYRVLRQLGRGGMGVVYLAERDDAQYQRRVAIKVVRPGASEDDVASRFRQERQILAALDHEHIATLLDGGTTERGQPYLVMEYVEGTPLDRYCDIQGLTVTQRLQLFRAVCAAVQFAHQNLVIHRDLKPSNVLVTAAGVPKLLDFGIAKLVNPALMAAPALATRREVRLMTPEYASPEQARGEHLNAASDVYALGVMLFELLTGQRPYAVADLPLHEVTRVICEQEPPRPSVLVRRGATTAVATDPATRPAEGTAERLSRRLAGDLDTIVLKALAKEPSRRYASVEQLSEDVRRHLEGLPVTARPDTLGYRAGKFVRRHRGSVSAAALLALALVAGAVTTAWQARIAAAERDRAERRFGEVRQLATSFLFEFHDAVVGLPGATPVRQLVVSRALRHLEGLAAEAEGDVPLQVEVAQAYLRVGDVQGNPRNPNLGDAAGAAKSYERARALLDDAVARDPRDGSAALQRAAATLKTADLAFAAGDVSDARRTYERALELALAAQRLSPGSVELDRLVYTCHLRYADLLIRNGDVAGATTHYEATIPLVATIAEPAPGRNAQFLEAVTHERLANLAEGSGDLTLAIERMTRALELHRARVAAQPDDAPSREAVGVILERRATLRERVGRVDDALADMTAATTQYRQVASADPRNARVRSNLLRALALLGPIATAAGRPREAEAASAEAIRLAQEEAERPNAAADAFNAYANALAIAPERLRRPRAALEYAQRAVAATKGTNPYFLETLALAQHGVGDLAGAIATLEEELRLLPAPPPGGRSTTQRADTEKYLAAYRDELAKRSAR